MAGQSFDYALDGVPFMLVRDGKGRAWHRSGQVDVPTRRSQEDAQYGNVPDTIDHPEVYDDWSGGLSAVPYRTDDNRNQYPWANGFDARWPRQLIHAQAPQLLVAAYATLGTNVVGFLDVPLPSTGQRDAGKGAVLVLQQNRIGILAPTNFPNTAASAFDMALYATTAQPTNAPAAIFGSFIYVGRQISDRFERLNLTDLTATQILNVGGAIPAGRWFAVAAQRMWVAGTSQGGTSPPNNIFQSIGITQDATASGNYSASISIGMGLPAGYGIALESQFYIGMPDGIYQGNSFGTFNNVLTDIGMAVDSDNFRDLTIHNGQVVGAAGPTIYAYKPSTIESRTREIGPPLGISPLSAAPAITGKFTCVKGFGRWLYAGLFTGSQSWLMVGHDASGPNLPYVWHPLHNFLGLTTKVSRIHVDTITTSSGGVSIPNRIWAATDASFGSVSGATAPVFYWPIPRGDNNPLFDPTFTGNYMGSASMDMLSGDWGAPAAQKVWRTARPWGDSYNNPTLDTGATRRLNVSYVVNRQPVFNTLVSLGVFPPLSQTGPAAADLYFTASPGAGVIGQTLTPHIDSFTALPIDPVPDPGTPIHSTAALRALVVRGLVRPNSNDTIVALTRIANSMTDRNGKRITQDMGAQLRTLRSKAMASGPSMLTDLVGNQAWVSVIPPIEEEEIYQQGQDQPEVQATVRMVVMTFSSNEPSFY